MQVVFAAEYLYPESPDASLFRYQIPNPGGSKCPKIGHIYIVYRYDLLWDNTYFGA